MIRSIKLRRFKCFEDEYIDIQSDGIKILAGPNNSGKSTFLQALAVWNFGILALREEKGDDAITDPGTNGFGISFHNFNAINLPDFKHMWYNKKSRYPEEGSTYTLSISVDWQHKNGEVYNLKASFSLKEDKIFIRIDNSTISDCNMLPKIVYLPPVAGLVADEENVSLAIRNRLLGRGLAGSVLRNVLLDLKTQSKEYYDNKKTKSKIVNQKNGTRSSSYDPWEELQSVLLNRFGFKVEMDKYNEAYHAAIGAYIESYRRDKSGKLSKLTGKRDLMTEGAGALQWICFCAYAVDPQTDILLLDEPDAHLHSHLQFEIVKELEHLMANNTKQIFIATHSAEILKNTIPQNVIAFANGTSVRVANDRELIKLLRNLGANIDRGYLISEILRKERVLFVEGSSDRDMIRILSNKLNLSISNIVIFPTRETHKDRRVFIEFLQQYCPNIKAISLRDLDEGNVDEVCKDSLRDKTDRHRNRLFSSRTLRRMEIENYALVPKCIARTVGVDVKDLECWWNSKVQLPWIGNSLEESDKIVTKDIKDILNKKLKQHRKVLADIWKNMKREEIHDDLKNIVYQVGKLNS